MTGTQPAGACVPQGACCLRRPGCGSRAVRQGDRPGVGAAALPPGHGRMAGHAAVGSPSRACARPHTRGPPPCVLWIIEIEKGPARGRGQPQTRRLIGQFLFWMQESSKVFSSGDNNDVSTLPPELLRKWDGSTPSSSWTCPPRRSVRRSCACASSPPPLHPVRAIAGPAARPGDVSPTGFAGSDIDVPWSTRLRRSCTVPAEPRPA